jgi:hypothetical protein
MEPSNLSTGKKPQVMYQETCSKCKQVISGTSENTLRINVAEHQKWHELHPNE